MQLTSNVYEYIGEIGPYQLILFILIATTSFSPTLTGYSYVFIGATPKHRCKLFENETYLFDKNISTILKEKNVTHTNYYLSTDNNYNSKCYFKSLHNNLTDIKFKKCDDWIYSKKYYDETLVTEWNLVCDKSHLKNLLLTLHFLGTFGVFISGLLSDRYGRKRTASLFILSNSVLSILTTILFYLKLRNFSLNIVLFSILKFLSGFTSSVYSIAVIFVIELTGKNKRVLASNFVAYTLVFSQIVLVLIAYFVRDFRLLQLIVSVILCSINSYFWIVPESPIWLLANGKKEEAERIFKKIAKSNNKQNDFEQLDKFAQLDLASNNKNTNSVNREAIILNEKNILCSLTLKKLLYSKIFVTKTCVLIFNWFTIQVIFYGISFYTSNFAGDPYLNFTLSICVELIAIIGLQLIARLLNNNNSFIASITISGLAFLISYFVSYKFHPYIATFLALIGKLCITFCFFRMYTITAETYPTNIRNSLTSFCLGIGRLGSVISPYIQLIGEMYWYAFPFVFFSLCSLASAVLFGLFIAENRNKKLPETIEEFLDN